MQLVDMARAQDDDFDIIAGDEDAETEKEDCGDNGELCDGGLQHHKYTRYLKFNEDGKFKFVNFSDLMLDDGSEDWLKTQGLVEKILNQEEPDLVVLTGDIVKPMSDYENGFDSAFGSALQAIKQRKIPYVWTGGNPIDGLSNYELHEIDYLFGGQYSWTGYVWDLGHEDMSYNQEELGYFTSRIPIMDPEGEDEITSIFTLDSSDKSCLHKRLPGETCISTKTVEWLGLQ